MSASACCGVWSGGKSEHLNMALGVRGWVVLALSSRGSTRVSGFSPAWLQRSVRPRALFLALARLRLGN
eukprot:11825244-Alexandrium_andersonii.AAC.1